MLLGWILPQCSYALDPELSLEQLHHTAWTDRDGVPDDIQAITQATDGYLWIGTGQGLYRFDGLSFERFRPTQGSFPSQGVYGLTATRDGAIWIGWTLGGATRINGGKATNFSPSEGGLPQGSLWSLREDHQGRLWAAGIGGLARFDGTRWIRIGALDGYSGRSAGAIHIDRSGDVAVFDEDAVHILHPGGTRFERSNGPLSVRMSPVQTADGTIYLFEDRGLRALSSLHRYASQDRPWLYRNPDGQNGTVLADRDGALWFDGPNTLYRIRRPSLGTPDPSSLQGMTKTDGLSGTVVYAIYEDREGNVWVATNGGLDRFRNSRFAQVTSPHLRNHPFLYPDRKGRLWIAARSKSSGWMQAGPDGVKRLGAGPIYVAHVTRDDMVWRAGRDRVSLWKRDREVWSGFPIGLPSGSFARAMAEQPNGDLWISVNGSGLWTLRSGRWGQDRRPGANVPVSCLFLDRDGTRWIGTPDGSVAKEVEGEWKPMSRGDLKVGHVMQISRSEDRLWVAGSAGVALVRDDGRVIPVQSSPADALEGLTGFLEASDGSLWTNGTAGVATASPQALRAWLASPGSTLSMQVFDARDGVRGKTGALTRDSVVEDAQRRLWLSTSAGLFWTKPENTPQSQLAPTVMVTGLHVDGQPSLDKARIVAAPGSKTLRIDFTATSLTFPERVRFRYRLGGFDPDWQEAAGRRQAFYNSLPPGKYRFQVVAANEAGIWNLAGATVDVTIEPRFVQTPWFLALCVLAGASVLLALYRLRVRALVLRMQRRFEARIEERERIARELHDTFLQGFQGLVLAFQSVARRIPHNSPARVLMDRALQRADEIMVEGRDRVQDLRSAYAVDLSLADRLAQVGQELSKVGNIRFVVTESGVSRRLAAAVEDEIYWIVREAIGNAFAHASAARIEVELTYAAKALQVRIVDDGIGIDPEVLEAGGRTGHFGLVGMRERARQIAGDLSIWSRRGAGTELVLRITAAHAYTDEAPPWRWRSLAARWRDKIPVHLHRQSPT